MARLFENADLGDVQARRREMAALKEQIQEAQKQVQEVEKQKEEAEKQKAEAEKQKAEAEERMLAVFVETLKEYGLPRESVLERLQVKFEIPQNEAEEILNQYWSLS